MVRTCSPTVARLCWPRPCLRLPVGLELSTFPVKTLLLSQPNGPGDGGDHPAGHCTATSPVWLCPKRGSDANSPGMGLGYAARREVTVTHPTLSLPHPGTGLEDTLLHVPPPPRWEQVALGVMCQLSSVPVRKGGPD